MKSFVSQSGGRQTTQWHRSAAVNIGRQFLFLFVLLTASFLLHASLALAVVLPDAGVTLGSWSDATATYFGSSTEFVLANNTVEVVTAPPLRVLALTDWQSKRRTEFLSLWPNRTSLTLWANRDLATSLVSRTSVEDLRYQSIWTTAPQTEPKAEPEPGRFPRAAAVTVVSAIGVDLIGSGDVDLLLQGSDGILYVLSHSTASYWHDSSAFDPIRILDTAATPTVTQLKEPSAPSVSLVPDFVFTTRSRMAVSFGIVFVNTADQLVLLSRVSTGIAANENKGFLYMWPPEYSPHVLVDEQSAQTRRAVLPFSLVAADINEDCAAELVYGLRDARQKLYEVHVVDTVAARRSSSNETLLLRLSEDDSGERYGDSFTMADINGDGLPELVIAVQLTNESNACAAADTTGVAEVCTPYHALRIFYPQRAAGASGAAKCRTAASSSLDHHVTYDLDHSELFVLTASACGVESWAGEAKTRLPLYMPSYPSSPLLLRAGDYNRDRLVDLVVSSSYGPLLLTSRAVTGARPLVCTALDSTTGRAAVAKASAVGNNTITRLDAYRTGVPFFATLGLLGRLEVVLTHHRVYAASSSASASSVLNQIVVYQNSEVPARSYFLSATASTVRSYGAGCVGATHHMAWQDIHMHTHYATLTQQGQTAGHALQPPHVLVGLDETFSYVHDYTIGVRVATDGEAQVQAKEWPSYLVPNAQVFAELLPAGKPSEWQLQLYLPTSTYRLLLVAALAIALVVIGVPVVCLRCFEIMHDYNELRMP